MCFNCQCGASVHLNIKSKQEDLPINLMCLNCFKERPMELFEVEYELPPLRAVYRSSILAVDSLGAKETLQQLKDEPSLRIRSVKKSEKSIKEQEKIV